MKRFFGQQKSHPIVENAGIVGWADRSNFVYHLDYWAAEG